MQACLARQRVGLVKFENDAASGVPIEGVVLDAISIAPVNAVASEVESTRGARSIVRALRDGSWITRGRLSSYPKLVIAVYLLATFCFLQNYGVAGTNHERLGIDFAPFYAASHLALSGHPAQSYDDASEQAAEQRMAGYQGASYEIWDYPPTYLLMGLPFSLLGYNLSLMAWILFSFAAYLSVLWAIAPDRNALWLAAAFPAAFVNMRDGQNGFVSLSLAAGGLLLLERRPLVAGLLFGLLSYKPQFGILLPIILAATGHWRAFASATVAILAMAALTTFLFGWDTWQAFFASVPITNHRLMVAGEIGFGKMQSVYGAARLWGASLATSYVLQASVSLATLATVLWVWREGVPFSMKAAALVTGTLLVTPYMLDYDLVLLAAPIAWLAYEGLHSQFLAWEKSVLFLAWICPLLSRPLSLSGFPLTPLVLAVVLIAIVRRSSMASGPLGATG